MFSEFDLDVQYNGPKSDLATFTGSTIWGYSVDDVIAIAQRIVGWVLQSNERFQTPYGLGPLVNNFVTPTGRDVIWIPSYSEVVGEDSLYHYNFEKAFLILWKAGVKIRSTCCLGCSKFNHFRNKIRHSSLAFNR